MAIRTPKKLLVKEDTLVVGIDIGKKTHCSVALKRSGQEKKSFFFNNDQAGFLSLLRYAEEARKELNCSEILIALEATGHYWKPLASWLEKRDFSLVVVNPAHTRWSKELADNSPLKDDSKDAWLVADLASQGKFSRCVLPKGDFAELRTLGKLWERTASEFSRNKNKLHRILDLIFPELPGLWSSVDAVSFLQLLDMAPTPRKALSLGFERLEVLLRKSSRGQLGEERAREVLRAAETSIGLDEVAGHEFELGEVIEDLRRLQDRRRRMRRRFEKTLARIPYAEKLLAIPQIGVVRLGTLLGETGNLRRFRTAREIVKLAGLNLYAETSGQFKEDMARYRITRRGRGLLRKTLYVTAVGITSGPIGRFQRRLKAKDKPSKVVGVAAARKLMRIIFAIARDGSEYNPGCAADAG